MEYLQKCFYKSTNWNEDNIFSNITATSQALLEFPIPNGCKVDLSSKATEHLASSFTLSNYHSINGSLAYLYSSIPLRNTMGTKDISLQDAISGFKMLELNPSTTNALQNPVYKNTHDSLLYGRMYFPGSALEAMIIKRISAQTQLLIKCINNPHLDKNGTMIVYLQKNTPKLLREFIYSTNEALFGFRCLYNFGSLESSSNKSNSSNLIPKFDNSVISIGTEIWYAALSMSPGLSTAFRYSTRSTSTGKPLTMTLACNPILGHISSAYTVKTSVASTFCSKYDFNVFSYASNLSLGFEIYNYSSNNTPNTATAPPRINNNDPQFLGSNNSDTKGNVHIRSPDVLNYKNHSSNKQNVIISPIQALDNYYHINPTLLPSTKSEVDDVGKPLESQEDSNNETAMAAFENLVNESDFSSVVKLSTSLNDKMLKLLWKGRCKDFLVTTGVKMVLNPVTNTPEFNRFGISFSYAC
ncbi:Mitochondrial distribution and morphology protein 10 [Debaryomyces fabryi]|uniref:Mitochondrial distribution and morphology protein 10 n=1 Tax=Debaryomyces fabryi TaxID=58627 RepID=A0A0V1Q0Z8_9ASCO|nr:Mitochondrial distribution and morphology protein 10 [Debaryomyces fabryi]KSA02114.1 Mitochondrial distribution and morphology protein 10 [Debaryomyces fabryi]